MVRDLLSVIGFAATASFSYRLFRALRLPKTDGRVLKDLSSQNAWAVITGASDGIGAEYAKELGSRGFNLLLISRTASKLENVASKIRANNSTIQIQTIAMDFVKEPIDDNFSTIEKALEPLQPIGILVNNVAMNYNYPQLFHSTPIEGDEKIVHTNISVTNRMTKLILPRMIQNNQGVILNLSSVTSLLPCPMLSVYSGTKAYIEQFSRSISTEYKSKGVICHAITPGLVATKMSKVSEGFLVSNPGVIVKNSLDCVGSDSIQIIPYLPHRLSSLAASLLPTSFVSQKMLQFNIEAGNQALAKEDLRKRLRNRAKNETKSSRRVTPTNENNETPEKTK